MLASYLAPASVALPPILHTVYANHYLRLVILVPQHSLLAWLLFCKHSSPHPNSPNFLQAPAWASTPWPALGAAWKRLAACLDAACLRLPSSKTKLGLGIVAWSSKRDQGTLGHLGHPSPCRRGTWSFEAVQPYTPPFTANAPKENCSIQDSHVVPHRSTN